MSLHDYRCLSCGLVLYDQYRSVAEGGRAQLPICPTCDQPMDWVPHFHTDLRSDGSPAFAKFTVYDGRNNLVEVDSLHTLRRIERESEVAYRNGEGAPMVFRAYSQNRGNRLDGTLGEVPQEKPSAAAKQKFGLQGGGKSVAPTESGEPERAYGPGVSDSNTSALK